MLKIKFSINEFTIIFFEKIGKKINTEKLSAQPSLFNFSVAPFSILALFFFQIQCLFLLLFSSSQRLFLLLFSSPSASPFLLFVFLLFSFVFSASFFFSSRRVALFLSAQKYFFQPKTFFTSAQNPFSAQNVFASAQNTFSVQPKTFLLQPKILFQFSPKISPCLWFSASFFLFLFFLPFFSAFSHYVFPFFSPSVQLKTFFTCFMSLYLSKSSFSSNLK